MQDLDKRAKARLDNHKLVKSASQNNHNSLEAILASDGPMPSMVTTTPLSSSSVKAAAIEAGLVPDLEKLKAQNYIDVVDSDEVSEIEGEHDANKLASHLSLSFNEHFNTQNKTESLHELAQNLGFENEKGELKEIEFLKQLREFNEEAQHQAQEQDKDEFNKFTEDDDEEDNDFNNGALHLVKGKQDSNKALALRSDHNYDNYQDVDYDDDNYEVKSNISTSTALVKAGSQGNIGAFIRAANQIPLLTEDEELSLARRLRDFGDLDAARKLVMSHLRLVVSVARGYTGYGLPLSDLIQEGNIGLMKAVKHFDPEIGGRLAAFAVHWIKAEINEYVIKNWRMVKVATTKAQRKLFFKIRQLKKSLGWMSEDERQDVANLLGVTLNDVTEMEKRMAGSDIGFDLDEDESNDKSVAITLSPSSYLEDENSNFALEYENHDYAAWENKKLVEALQSLDDRAQYILKRRWLDESKATLQELSRELNVSIERVRQLENNALNKLKTILLSAGVKSQDGDEIKALPDLKKSRALVVKNKVNNDEVKTPKKRGRKPKVKNEEQTLALPLKTK